MLDALNTLSIAAVGGFSENDIKFLAVGGGLTIGLVAVIASYTRSILIGRSREQSRREIAAYIAEGSMSAEDGAKLLNAGRPVWERGEAGKKGC